MMKKIIIACMWIIWIVCGFAGVFIIPGSNLTSQWGYGFLFGIGFFTGSQIIGERVFWILYNNIPIFKNHVDNYWGNPVMREEQA